MSIGTKLRKYLSYEYGVEKVENEYFHNHVYRIEHYRTKKSFLFNYDTNYNFEKNLRVLISLMLAHFPLVEIKNCKYGEHVLDEQKFSKCRSKCFYRCYCERRKEEGL